MKTKQVFQLHFKKKQVFTFQLLSRPNWRLSAINRLITMSCFSLMDSESDTKRKREVGPSGKSIKKKKSHFSSLFSRMPQCLTGLRYSVLKGQKVLHRNLTLLFALSVPNRTFTFWNSRPSYSWHTAGNLNREPSANKVVVQRAV